MSESALLKRNKARQRTKIRIRKKISGTEQRPRMSVFKSGKHIYAQIVCDVTGKTLVSASTLDKELGQALSNIDKEGLHNESRSHKSVAAAKAVGLMIAKRGLEKNVTTVVFDRNGFVYKGRIKAIADGAKAGGLKL